MATLRSQLWRAVCNTWGDGEVDAHSLIAYFIQAFATGLDGGGSCKYYTR